MTEINGNIEKVVANASADATEEMQAAVDSSSTEPIAKEDAETTDAKTAKPITQESAETTVDEKTDVAADVTEQTTEPRTEQSAEQSAEIAVENKFDAAVHNASNGATRTLPTPADDIDVQDISSSDSSSDSGNDSDAQDNEEVDDNDDDDDEGRGEEGPIRSKNEIAEEPVIAMPEDYKLAETDRIQCMGTIKSLYQNNIIVAASQSGEQRVLREGAIFCLESRQVLGTLSEVFGPLQSPFYRVCVAPEKLDELEPLIRSSIGNDAYYVVPEAHWVDTFELRRDKGTDASNGYDEELPESEQEFSDDEKEAQYKRGKKAAKGQAKNKTKGKGKVQKPGRDNTRDNKKVGRTSYPAMRVPAAMAPQGNTHGGYRSRDTRREQPQVQQQRNPAPMAKMQQNGGYYQQRQQQQAQAPNSMGMQMPMQMPMGMGMQMPMQMQQWNQYSGHSIDQYANLSLIHI